MTSKLFDAIADVRQYAKFMHAVQVIAEEAEKLESIEQLQATIRRNISQLDTDLERKHKELDEVLAKKALVETELEAHREYIAKAEIDADAASKEIIAKATLEAEKIIEAAVTKKNAVDAEIIVRQATLDRIVLETNDAHNLYNEAAAKLQAKRDEIRAIAG
jgi:hypothetical protein